MSTSVMATVQYPEPDPDRPHCVIISGTYRLIATNPVHDDFIQTKLILHSRYPIYTEWVPSTAYDPNGKALMIKIFYGNASRKDTRCVLTQTGRWNNEYDNGRYTNTTSVEFLFPTYTYTTPVITYQESLYGSNCEIVSEPTVLTIDSLTGTAGNRFRRLELEIGMFNPNSTTIPLGSGYLRFGYRTDNQGSSTQTVSFKEEHYTIGSSYVNDGTASVYNFNNPIFSSAEAWLNYCKENV